MTHPNQEHIFGDLTKGFPTIAEQREVDAHNAPIIETLQIAVNQAQRLFGQASPEYAALCRVFDAAISIANTADKL